MGLLTLYRRWRRLKAEADERSAAYQRQVEAERIRLKKVSEELGVSEKAALRMEYEKRRHDPYPFDEASLDEEERYIRDRLVATLRSLNGGREPSTEARVLAVALARLELSYRPQWWERR